MKLIVGLGNPGRQYERTRHNVGWWVVEHLADVWHLGGWRERGQVREVSGRMGNVQVRLLEPLTYMNLSGNVLRSYLRRPFWTPPKDLLVVVDEVALPVGRYRLRARGSAGGHNGLRSVETAIGNQEYPRLRIGVGPSEERKGIYKDLADFVLAPFARDERNDVIALMPNLENAVEIWMREGIERAMNAHNRRAAEPTEE